MQESNSANVGFEAKLFEVAAFQCFFQESYYAE